MNSLIPFDSAKVPSTIANMFGGKTNDLVGASASGGFPVISIKGKVFHIQRGDERTLITKPGDDDPAASIEVVIVKANPNRSKVFYAHGFVEGDKAKPTCYSNSGIEPEKDSAEPQAKKCATCPHNQWGSRVTEDGRKGKACSDSRRIAISQVGAPGDPMLLRVPAASMKSLEEYGKVLAARGVPPQAVVTKIGFDYSVAHPALTFKPVGFIADAEQLAEIKEVSDGDIAAQIVGLQPLPTNEAEHEEHAYEAPPAVAPIAAPTKAVERAAPKPAPAPAPKPVVKQEAEDDEAPAPRRAKADPIAAIEAMPKTATKTMKVEGSDGLDAKISETLSSLDDFEGFDD